MKLNVSIPEFQKRIDYLREFKRPYVKMVSGLNKQITEIEGQEQRHIVENKLYLPLSILEKYKGRTVSSIVFICQDGETFDGYNSDDLDEIDENGHYYHSSYEGGITYWNDKVGDYCHDYHYCTSKLNIIGIKEINLSDESEGEA